jgi:formamidase
MAGEYRLPWEVGVKIADGTSCGLAAPTREYRPDTLPLKMLRKAG